MKAAFAICLVLFLAACAFKSHFDGVCQSYRFAGSSINLQGVFCWRRENDTFDNFEPLKDLEQREHDRKKMQDCIDAGRGVECDPRYVPPQKIIEGNILREPTFSEQKDHAISVVFLLKQ